MAHSFARVLLRAVCMGICLLGTASAANAAEAVGGGIYLTLDDLQPVAAAAPPGSEQEPESAAPAPSLPAATLPAAPPPDLALPSAPAPGEFGTEQRPAVILPPDILLEHPDDPSIDSWEYPGTLDDYRSGPGFFFGIEAELYPDLPLEPYYFNQSDTPRYDPRHSWDRWRDYNRRRLRESGPRPQYGIPRPSDPVRRAAPGRRYEWRDRAGGQNVRRPRER